MVIYVENLAFPDSNVTVSFPSLLQLSSDARCQMPDSCRLFMTLHWASPLELSFPFILLRPILFQTSFRIPNIQWCISLSSMLFLCLEISWLWSFTCILSIYPLRFSSDIPFQTFSLKVSLDQGILTGAPLIPLDPLLRADHITLCCSYLFMCLPLHFSQAPWEQGFFLNYLEYSWQQQSSWTSGYNQS